MQNGLWTKGFVFVIIGLFIGTGINLIVVTAETSKTYTTIYVDGDNTVGPWDGTKEHPYQKIENGVNAASSGDTVFVYNGSYNVGEGININYPLNLIGEDKYNTEIKGNTRGDVIKIFCSDVSISYFTLKYSKRNDVGKKYAGVYIQGLAENINISNNIITENTLGIYAGDTTNLMIYNNLIYNNDYDGIVLGSSSDFFIFENEIYHNGYTTNEKPNGGGIGIWISYCGRIINNTISDNKVDGIWIDCHKSEIYDILISNNQIVDNKNIGIHFGTSISGTYKFIKNNTFSYNLIKNNIEGGISINYAEENQFYENTIEGNGNFGIKISYAKDLICKNNTIYHNNFINNGRHCSLKGNIFCNGVDSKGGYNLWDNENISDKLCANCSSENGGNYWSDYEDGYSKKFENNLWIYHGIWKEKYGMKIQLLFLWYNKGFIYTPITLNFLKSKVFDNYPWCRMNGWNPNPPDKPSLKAGESITDPKTWNIDCSTNDSNDDKIYFEFQIIDNSTQEPIVDWKIINPIPINSSETSHWSHTFSESGIYILYVRAYDTREIYTGKYQDYNGRGFDGDGKKSECAQQIITVR
jgi:parallel beta-helix repeat protein